MAAKSIPTSVTREQSRGTWNIVSTIGQYAVNVLLACVFIFPLVFMLMASLKNNAQIFEDLRSLRAFLPVGELSLANYNAVFTRSCFPRFLFNSIFVAALTIGLGLLVNSMAAFALSRLRWKGQKLVLAIIIATLIIPGEAVTIPLLQLVSMLPSVGIENGLRLTQGWLNSYHVLIIPFIASAFSIFLFYQFFQDIPKDLDEAAFVDGANQFQIYRHVIVPVSGPVFATVAILTFLGSWNMFMWPIMTVQSEEYRPVMVGMSYFFQQDVQWGEVMAYATMVTIPVLGLFLAFQRSFVQSIAGTGSKEG